jgi:hypothetical protein
LLHLFIALFTYVNEKKIDGNSKKFFLTTSKMKCEDLNSRNAVEKRSKSVKRAFKGKGIQVEAYYVHGLKLILKNSFISRE